MSDDIRRRALDLYKAPFKYDHGYIWDANGEMVADDRVPMDDTENPQRSIAVRIRGWGRIGYLPEPEKLQDAVGELIAQALTKFWEGQEAAAPDAAAASSTIATSGKCPECLGRGGAWDGAGHWSDCDVCGGTGTAKSAAPSQ